MHAPSPTLPLLRRPPRGLGTGTTEDVEAVGTDPLVLVVEDDPEAAALTVRALDAHGLAFHLVKDAAEMNAFMAWRRPDLVVLDLGTPREDRLSTCLRLRDGGPPVIIVSARGDEMDRIIGLDMGAADYLAKPFNPRELVARIRAVLRRTPGGGGSRRVRQWRFAHWTLDAEHRRLIDSTGAFTLLSTAEFDMLMAFCRHAGQTLSRGRLQDIIQGPCSTAQERSVDLAVRRLRIKIEPNPSNPSLVQTVRSYGYILSVPVHPVL